MANEYPKMLYRPAKGEGNMVWGERVDTLVVNSLEEEVSAKKRKWINNPTKACEMSAKMKRRMVFYKWFASHWKFWITCIIAIAGVVITFLTIPK